MGNRALGRPVYFISGGVSQFTKARQDLTFGAMVKESTDQMVEDLNLPCGKFIEILRKKNGGTKASYFSDHYTRQLMAGIMAQDIQGFCPLSSNRVEGGGATGGICFQEAVKDVASGYLDLCVAFGFETMSHVRTWKGNEFIALASDTDFDYPVGGFYSGYYAMMVTRHMYEFGTTVEQMAMVSVKNHRNAFFNPYAQKREKLTIDDVRKSEMVAWPLTRRDICVMSDGAASCLVVSEEGIEEILKAGGNIGGTVKIIGIGRGTDMMRMADRPHGEVVLLPWEKEDHYRDLKYPGVHSFRAGRVAAREAYGMAGITDPLEEIDFIELHDAYTSSEIQTYEDLGLCKYGDGGRFVESGASFLKNIDYGFPLTRPGKLPVNPSGGLIACGHPVGATGLMQAVFSLWQIQGTIKKHFGTDDLQIPEAKTGLWHSHAGTGTYVTVTIGEKV
ncbi:MAG: thiolase domain-containing protein [Nitrospirae bacterium]|nr:thiolase domain-containing protein [Nitrospirota bacterium]MBI3352430.1 thiolase domain-containing protein [Nitrospirota bacterium]